MKAPEDILDFWFSDETKARWFKSTPDFDGVIRERFEETARALAEGPFPNPVWEKTHDAALALALVLDQFPRNMFRGTPGAFAWDPLALSVAERIVDRGWDMLTAQDRRAFIYMPFMHSEDLMHQNRCVELTGARLDDKSTLRHAKAHRKVIERFGRFPHRNAVLGRQSTADEHAFLQDGGYDPS